MNQHNSPKLPSKLYAEAVVHSVSGESLLDSPSQVTSENVFRFYATADRLQAVAQQLRQAGFEVLDIGKISITIAAAPEVYERSFQTTLEAVERPVIKELGKINTATFMNAVDRKPFGEIDVSGTAWHGLLDGIAINEPIYYFRTETPSTVPPTTPAEYLSVPDGVIQGLNASTAHQQGITGKGIKVAMVDSGWYPHPFFNQHDYKVRVCLAPNSSDPQRDDIGHGTGESANLLAIAPDVALTMVKADVELEGKLLNVNSISALRTAIALQPDIISCSWGSDERKRALSPYNRVLAVTVADAVRQGIIIIFSAGNGHCCFPAQHPEVIAAGGVYLQLSGSLRGTLEASNYASSFISPIYPGRQVPDVCGLVGKLPYGSYIMLPVQPGCKIDRQLAFSPDGTEESDGWAAFSGTSAAAPQLAGICALMKQVNPQLSPAEAKRILQHTARDVVEGFSNLSISDANFIPRSPVTKSAYYLREILDECLNEAGELTQADEIDEEHIFAAEGLLKLGKYQETALNLLTQILCLKLDRNTKNDLKSSDSMRKEKAEGKQKHFKNLRKLASQALSECGSEVATFEFNSPLIQNFFNRQTITTCDGEQVDCDVTGRYAIGRTNGKHYCKRYANSCWKEVSL
jgi:serine protease AprX